MGGGKHSCACFPALAVRLVRNALVRMNHLHLDLLPVRENRAAYVLMGELPSLGFGCLSNLVFFLFLPIKP